MCIPSFRIQSATKDEFEIFVKNAEKMKMFEEQKGENTKCCVDQDQRQSHV